VTVIVWLMLGVALTVALGYYNTEGGK